MCKSCGLCKCGEIKELCEQKGYQFYISPSVGFTKRLTQRKQIKAAIGAACMYEIKKGMNNERITLNGVNIKQTKVIPQAISMPKYDCIDNNLDWDKLKRMIEGN